MKIVRIAGRNKAIEIFNETKRIEADGGMLIMVIIIPEQIHK